MEKLKKLSYFKEWQEGKAQKWDTEHMRAYEEKANITAIKTEDGYFIDIEKEALQKNFCRAHGDSYTQTDYTDKAWAALEKIQNEEKEFISENFKQSRNAYPLKKLKETRAKASNFVHVYIMHAEDCGLDAWFRVCTEDEAEEKRLQGLTVRQATERELDDIEAGLQIALDDLEKRCRSYWKKYQGTKLNCWTYYSD